MNAAEKRGLTITWVPFRSSSYKETEIEKYQSAWSPKRPIATLPKAEQDEAWVVFASRLKRLTHASHIESVKKQFYLT